MPGKRGTPPRKGPLLKCFILFSFFIYFYLYFILNLNLNFFNNNFFNFISFQQRKNEAIFGWRIIYSFLIFNFIPQKKSKIYLFQINGQPTTVLLLGLGRRRLNNMDDRRTEDAEDDEEGGRANEWTK